MRHGNFTINMLLALTHVGLLRSGKWWQGQMHSLLQALKQLMEPYLQGLLEAAEMPGQMRHDIAQGQEGPMCQAAFACRKKILITRLQGILRATGSVLFAVISAHKLLCDAAGWSFSMRNAATCLCLSLSSSHCYQGMMLPRRSWLQRSHEPWQCLLSSPCIGELFITWMQDTLAYLEHV